MSLPEAESVKEALTKQIAVLSLNGFNATQIASELKANGNQAITRFDVKRIMDTPLFNKVVGEMGDEVLAPAVAKAKRGLARLADKAIEVLEKCLDEGDLDAAKVVFKGIGLDNQEQVKQDGGLTVILPGAKQEQVINAEHRVITIPSEVQEPKTRE